MVGQFSQRLNLMVFWKNFFAYSKYFFQKTYICIIETSPSADSFKCRECQYKSNTRNNLQRHIRKHHTKTFQCSKCPYTGSCKSELLRHTRQVHLSETDRRRPTVVDNIPDSSQAYVCEVCFIVKTSFEESEQHKTLHQITKWFLNLLIFDYLKRLMNKNFWRTFKLE